MQIRSAISDAISSGSKAPETIDQLLMHCASESADPQRRAIFEICISALNAGAGETLQTQVAKGLIGRLLFEVCLSCTIKIVKN